MSTVLRTPTRVRIVVRKLPGCENIPTSLSDCSVFLIHEDGHEEPLTNVESVSIKIEPRGEPVRACVRLINVEVDAELEGAEVGP